MTDLTTSFAGLALRNPIIISSSGLSDSVEKNIKLTEAGAGAIVLKSLFEEQILLDTEQMLDPTAYPEGNDYLTEYVKHHKLGQYLDLIKGSKEKCTIPIIASVNCYSDSEWISFAKKIEEAGADAIEINILAIQANADYKYGEFEQKHIDILKHIKQTVQIPIIMKLGENLTNPIALIDQLYANGADGIVLFNRFYQPDIDINKMRHVSGPVFSQRGSLSTSLRWVGIASATVPQIDYAASGGVHTPEDLIKVLLAGASAVEVCSAIYKHGPAYVRELVSFLGTWMNANGFEKVSQFKGKLNSKTEQGVSKLERTQFLRYFSSRN